MDYERHIYKIFLPVLDYESIRLYLSYKFPYEKQEVLRHIISSAVIIVREKIHYEQEIKKITEPYCSVNYYHSLQRTRGLYSRDN